MKSICDAHGPELTQENWFLGCGCGREKGGGTSSVVFWEVQSTDFCRQLCSKSVCMWHHTRTTHTLEVWMCERGRGGDLACFFLRGFNQQFVFIGRVPGLSIRDRAEPVEGNDGFPRGVYRTGGTRTRTEGTGTLYYSLLETAREAPTIYW